MSYDSELRTPQVQSALREAQKELGTLEKLFVLGDGEGRLGAGKNRLWAREVLSDGQLKQANRVVAWSHKTGNYYRYIGSPVVCGYIKGQLTVLGQNNRASEALGINPAVLNTGDPQLQGVSTTSLLPLLCHAVGTSVNPSTKVGIKSFRYYDHENTVGWYVGSVANQVDLASFIPIAGEHRYVAIFFNTSDQTFTVKGSTAQSTVIPLDDTDKQECYDEMPPYSIPVAMWRLADAQTAVVQSNFIEDLRPLYGRGTARHNYSATIAPTVNDDSGDGYGIGSIWINVTTDDIYICADATLTSAVWQQVSGGGFTSWTLAGDLGTPQTINDGNTATIAGDNYVQTTAGATDTLTVRYIASPLHIMGW